MLHVFRMTESEHLSSGISTLNDHRLCNPSMQCFQKRMEFSALEQSITGIVYIVVNYPRRTFAPDMED